jgi:hypothetical protein
MSTTKSKEDLINERVAKLPLPEDPPTEPDWNSANAETVNARSSDEVPKPSNAANEQGTTSGLYGTATKGSGVRESDGADMSDIGRTKKG